MKHYDIQFSIWRYFITKRNESNLLSVIFHCLCIVINIRKRKSKVRRDMNLSEHFYKVGSIFLQNSNFDVTVGIFDAKTL